MGELFEILLLLGEADLVKLFPTENRVAESREEYHGSRDVGTSEKKEKGERDK